MLCYLVKSHLNLNRIILGEYLNNNDIINE